MKVFTSKSDAIEWLKRKGFPNCTVLIQDRPYRIMSYFRSEFTGDLHWAGMTWFLSPQKIF